MIEDDLPANWGAHRGRLSLHQRKMRGRKSWFVRMAMKGFVPAPGVKSGKKQLVAASLPELFDSAGQVPYHQRERWGLLEPNGMPIGKLRQLRVKVPDSSVWVPVLVKARTDRAAARLLAGALPEGTEIGVDIRGANAGARLKEEAVRVVPAEGLEPPTFGLQNRCSTN